MNTNIIELPKKTEEIESFLWVTKALSKDKNRAVINLLHIEKATDKTGGTLACAMDGRRLHIARIGNDIAEPGDYKIIKATAAQFIAVKDENGATFPKVLNVIPGHKPDEMTKITLLFCRTGEDAGGFLFDIAVKFYSIKQSNFNVNYLSEAVAGLTGIYVHQAENISPVLIKDAPEDWQRLAVVMPRRVS